MGMTDEFEAEFSISMLIWDIFQQKNPEPKDLIGQKERFPMCRDQFLIDVEPEKFKQ